MHKVTRRDILATFASSVALAANPAHALTCDVRRSRSGDVSTKSYKCQLGEGKSLTATFMRISDILADSAGRGLLPKAFDDFEAMASSTHLIENKPLKTFQSLMDRYSYAFETYEMTVEFDGRGSQGKVSGSPIEDGLNNRYRTLGYWDESNTYTLPFFPIPNLLRRAFKDSSFQQHGFLRFAGSHDFLNFEGQLADYLGLWQAGTGEDHTRNIRWYTSKSLELLNHIQAGSVENFLPLFFTSNIQNLNCGGAFEGGGSYAPPALYVDIVVCKNDGTEPILVDDFFGANDTRVGLRAYDPNTPPESSPLSWGQIELQPGESVFAVQRLLFTAQPVLNVFNESNDLPNLRSQRAVFDQTELPKGVIVNGEAYPFDGRSHNSLILASYSDGGCCPYLYSWCETAQEWISSGKVMVDHIGVEKTAEDSKRYDGVRARFKLIEHEHERTFLSGLTRMLSLRDGTMIEQIHSDCEAVLDIGQSHEVSFDLPLHVDPEDIVTTTLTLRGYYDKYTMRHIQERREALCAVT
ncbi:MAG: hypothetical protein KUG74_10750 [Rhodobacteraceae bacterium]|nr:hypothetical protein [Paracoccaceae bacterium]